MNKFLPRLATLLCVFLFCAAIDTVPDPPAVTPSQVHAQEGLIAVMAANPSEHLSAELLQHIQLFEDTSWCGQIEAYQQQPSQVALRRDASNTSPPSITLV